MQVRMTKTIEMCTITLKAGDVVSVIPHETMKDVFYVEGVPETELLLNSPQVFIKIAEKAA